MSATYPTDMEDRPQPRLEDPFSASPAQKTTHTQDENRASNPRPSRRTATRRPLGELYYTQDEIVKLTHEIYDDTINEILLYLFIDWVRQKPENFVQARDNIRELSLDQASHTLFGYDTSRIANSSLQRLLDDVADLRPAYNARVLLAGVEAISLTDMLREEAVSPQNTSSDQDSPLSSRKWLRPMPALKSPKLFTSLQRRTSRYFQDKSGDSKMSSASSPSDHNASIFGNQMAFPISSPLPSPLQVRPASPKAYSLRKTPSLVMSSLRSRSQQYPPDTPDRPAPLNIRPRTASGSNIGAMRSASTPSRTRLPSLSLAGLSSPPMPAIPSPLHSSLRSSPLALSFPVSPSGDFGADLPGALGGAGEDGEEEEGRGVVDLATLPHEAVAWRNRHEGALIAHFGRKDVELTVEDVEMVERWVDGV